MHSLNPYLIKCHDPNAEKNPAGHKNALLSSVRGKDLLHLLRDFIATSTDKYTKIEDDKKVYSFSSVNFDESRREIFGFMFCGNYGVGTNIIDIKDGKIVFQKGVDNADMIRHFFHFYVPYGMDKALCMLTAFNGDGVKTLFFSLFDSYFRKHAVLNLSVKPVSYEKALADWQAGQAKEIRIVGFKAVPHQEDVEKYGGHIEAELVLKPPRKGNFGQFLNFSSKDTQQHNLVGILEQLGAEVKTVVQLAGKKRTFRVGTHQNNVICQIDFPDDMPLDAGMPILDDTYRFSSEIISEFHAKIYPGLARKYHERKD